MSGLQIMVRRWPRTNDELWHFVKMMWGREIPREQVCPDHASPFDCFADSYFARVPNSLWLGSRGLSGKTVQLSTLTLTEAVTLGVKVSLLGGSAAQSVNAHENIKNLWLTPNAPAHLLAKEPTRYDTYLNNGAHIRALMASTKSVRGPHPARLRLDEVDEMELVIYDDALGQPMPQNGVEPQTTGTSTHQYPAGTVTTLKRRAAEKALPVVSYWCYRESKGTKKNPGWLSQAEIDRKRSVIPEHVWEIEYELGEPSIEGRAIAEEAIQFMFDSDLGEYKGALQESIIMELPVEGARYITGIDWARDKDFTVIRTFRDQGYGLPWREVAFERTGRMSWPMIVERANIRLRTYGGVLIHDNTGLGSVVNDMLDVPRKVTVIPVDMVGRRREQMLSEYIGAIEHRHIKTARIEYAYGEHRYMTSNDVYGNGHTPDSVVAGALAWLGRNEGGGLLLPALVDEFARETSPWRGIS